MSLSDFILVEFGKICALSTEFRLYMEATKAYQTKSLYITLRSKKRDENGKRRSLKLRLSDHKHYYAPGEDWRAVDFSIYPGSPTSTEIIRYWAQYQKSSVSKSASTVTGVAQ